MMGVLSNVNGIYFFSVVVITVVVHELGHYWVASKQGVYKGWGLLPTPHIKLSERFENRSDYMSGISASLVTLPLWLLIGVPLVWSVVFLLVLGIGDLLPIILWKKVLELDEVDGS